MSKVEFYDFDNLMNRGYGAFESTIKGSKTKTFIQPVFEKKDRKSYIHNFYDVCASIDRDPEEIKTYIGKELCMDTSIKEGGSLKIDAIVKSGLMIQTILGNYITENVMCKACKSCHTESQKIDRITYLVCNTCHSKRSLEKM